MAGRTRDRIRDRRHIALRPGPYCHRHRRARKFPLMTIGASELHSTGRSTQFLFQVQLVIELDGSWIRGAVTQSPEFRMSASKRSYVCGNRKRTFVGTEVGVALRTSPVAYAGQPGRLLVLHMAGAAGGRERLRCLVRRAVVTGLTGPIGDCMTEAGLRVTGRAVLTEDRVRVREGATRVRRFITGETTPAEPENTHQHQSNRKQPPPARDGIDGLKVSAVDALR